MWSVWRWWQERQAAKRAKVEAKRAWGMEARERMAALMIRHGFAMADRTGAEVTVDFNAPARRADVIVVNALTSLDTYDGQDCADADGPHE